MLLGYSVCVIYKGFSRLTMTVLCMATDKQAAVSHFLCLAHDLGVSDNFPTLLSQNYSIGL